MHTLKKQLPRLAAFLLIAALLTGYLVRVLEDKNGTIRGLYAEPDNTIDVLYLGGSHANAAFDPVTLYEEYGYTGYVAYSWAQPVWTSYYYLEEALKTQTPQVVVFDAFAMAYGNTYISTGDTDDTSDTYSLLIHPGLTRARLALAMSRCQAEHKSVTRYLSYINFHNRWKTLTADDWLWPFIQEPHSANKGFGPLYKSEAFEQVPQDTSAQDVTVYEPCWEYFEKIVSLTRAKGIDLVVTVTPYVVSGAEEYTVFTQLQAYCEQQNIPFINYFDEENASRAGFDYASDLADHGHVNYRGAEKITEDLGAYLAANYTLPDHRGDAAYAQWQTDAAGEQADKAVMSLKLQSTLQGLLQAAAEQDTLTILELQGDLTASDPGDAGEILAAYGIPADALNSTSAGGLYVLEQGTLVFSTERSLVYTNEALDAGAYCDSDTASVTLHGIELSVPRSGIHVTVISRTTGEELQSIVFASDDNYNPYTD